MRKRSKFAVIAVLLLAVAGCSEVSKEQVDVLQVASLDARERATAFAAVANIITSRDAADTRAVQDWIKEHSAGLNTQAMQIAEIVNALSFRRNLNDITVKSIVDTADTACARSKVFTQMSLKLKGCAPENEVIVNQFIVAHQQALSKQAAVLRSFADKLKAKAKAQ